MTNCKYITKNGRCGLKGSYAYRHGCFGEDMCKCREPLTNADRIPGATDVDKAAHRVLLAAERDDDIRWRPSCVSCRTCGAEMETYYCEERLYMVRCRKCEKVVLVKNSGPKFAAEEANDGQH